MPNRERPEIVYKYRRFDDPDHLRILSDGEIYFLAPSRLNDPMDCRNPFRFWNASIEKNREFLLLSYADLPEFNINTQEQVYADIEYRLSTKPLTREAQIAEEIYAVQSRAEAWGLFCASCDIENVKRGFDIDVMWDRYSDNGSGFCAGIRVAQLFASADGDPDGFFSGFINYGELPILTPYLSDGSVRIISDQDVLDMVLNKTLPWADENEWRWIRRNNIENSGAGSIILQPTAIECIYLGRNVSDENYELSKELLRRRQNRPLLFKLGDELERIDY